MADISIRRALPADAAAIVTIYNHYVLHSPATFDTAEKTVEEREAWLADHGDSHPVFVAEREGVVVGWSSLSPYRDRPGWRYTVEAAVYLEPSETGQGLGPQLLAALIVAAREAGHHAVLSQIVASNEASLKMAERAGFERVGYLREVGHKFDRWIDLVIMQLVLPPG